LRQLEISVIELQISVIDLQISAINCRYLQIRIKCENSLPYTLPNCVSQLHRTAQAIVCHRRIVIN